MILLIKGKLVAMSGNDHRGQDCLNTICKCVIGDLAKGLVALVPQVLQKAERLGGAAFIINIIQDADFNQLNLARLASFQGQSLKARVDPVIFCLRGLSA